MVRESIRAIDNLLHVNAARAGAAGRHPKGSGCRTAFGDQSDLRPL